MSAIVTAASAGDPWVARLQRMARRNTWVLGLWVLFVGLLAATRVIQPNFGPSIVSALALAALPVALAAAGQTIAVLTGGIDLSIGSMMAVTSVAAASLMDGSGDGFAVAAVVVVIGIGLLMGAINGALVVVSRVPDIIVTLAMLFVWGGVALLILNAPGGAAADWLRNLAIGTIGSDWVPRALILLILLIAVVWIPLRRSVLGLSIYAVGSDSLAAFRSGVRVGRTKVVAYAVTGLFAALAGLALVMATGQGDPVAGPYLLLSVAAVVLGGVSLSGGRGGIVGPILAVFILRLARADMAFIGVDPGYATVIEGAIMVGVVMVGATIMLRRDRT